MKYVHIIDENGFYLENSFVEEVTPFTIETPIPSGVFYTPRWNGEAWEEGATQEYIDSLKQQPQEPTETELLQSEIADLKDRLAKVEAVPLVKTALEPVAEKTIT